MKGFILKNNRELISKELERSFDSLKASEKLFNEGLYADSVSRSYYACLHSAKAVLLLKSVEVDSHRAAVMMFGKHCVQSGDMGKAFGIILREQKEDRELGDYDVFNEIGFDRAKKRLDDAKSFVGYMRKFIEERGL